MITILPWALEERMSLKYIGWAGVFFLSLFVSEFGCNCRKGKKRGQSFHLKYFSSPTEDLVLNYLKFEEFLDQEDGFSSL